MPRLDWNFQSSHLEPRVLASQACVTRSSLKSVRFLDVTVLLPDPSPVVLRAGVAVDFFGAGSRCFSSPLSSPLSRLPPGTLRSGRAHSALPGRLSLCPFHSVRTYTCLPTQLLTSVSMILPSPVLTLLLHSVSQMQETLHLTSFISYPLVWFDFVF